MKEAFLHSLWKYRRLSVNSLKTTKEEDIEILNTGLHNETESGPDFFKAELIIDGQHWVGNLEIHLKSSDWYAHHHENDPAYDNVILHVVWEDDASIFRKDESEIPCLELQNYVTASQLETYQTLFEEASYQWINCETHFGEVNEFKLKHWLERLYIERLEEKNQLILNLLEISRNNWDEVCFKLLAKAFGLNVNGEAFLQMASAVDYKVFQKCFQNPVKFEALCFGLSGMLLKEPKDSYSAQLIEEFEFLKHKFQIKAPAKRIVKYFRLRPDNFPSIRISQFCQLYTEHPQLFKGFIECESQGDLHNLLSAKTSPYWNTHYTFGKETPHKLKSTTKAFKDLLILNMVIPIKFAYAKFKDQLDIEEQIFPIVSSLKPESNTIVKGFNKLRKNVSQTAIDSQALVQLKKKYCDLNRCMKCQIGLELIKQ
ncbi:DUF2851 family protein [Psychroflexus tropicus]|uniref:DUF2851 family protein n=1 Tax=Psychroflexus tropicus TaxID=197345 RepID=UPI000476E31F|nr:DUF2851 family protein [Psychroflexus tropicus]